MRVVPSWRHASPVVVDGRLLAAVDCRFALCVRW